MRRENDPRYRCDHAAELSVLPAWHAGVLVLGATLVAAIAIVGPTIAVGGAHVAPLGTGLLGLSLAVGGSVAVARISRVSPGAVFLRRPDSGTVRWAVIGLALASVVPLTLAASGSGRFVVASYGLEGILLALLGSVMLGLWTGAVEELLLRGYVLAVVGARWHWPGAVFVSALVFGLLHHGGADTALGRAMYVAVTATAGAVFALVTLSARNVWPAIGMHAAWNTALGPGVFGSGSLGDRPSPVIRYAPSPDHALLGGEHVPPTEAPVVLLAFLGILAILLRRSDVLAPDVDPDASERRQGGDE